MVSQLGMFGCLDGNELLNEGVEKILRNHVSLEIRQLLVCMGRTLTLNLKLSVHLQKVVNHLVWCTQCSWAYCSADELFFAKMVGLVCRICFV